MFDSIKFFFNTPFFTIYGGITALFTIAIGLYTIYLVIKGILPVWYRLGIGLSKRNIAIFAVDEYSSLNSLLKDSKIFKNIIQINKNDIIKAQNETLYLVHWKAFGENIDDILRIKKDSTPLIIYAPQNEGFIDLENMQKINTHRNSIVVNFRGRLLNDILVSLITTSYDK